MFAMPPAPPTSMVAKTRAPIGRALPTTSRAIPNLGLPEKVYGPDVSIWTGWVNWPSVVQPQLRSDGTAKPTVRFGFTKATQGRYVDRTLASNWRGMRQAGLIRGAYDFADFRKNPVRDARFYVRTMNRVGGIRSKGDFVVLDAEGVTRASKTRTVRWIRKWTKEVRRLTHLPTQRVVIYTGSWWWGPHTGNTRVFAKKGYRLWLSGYGRQPSLPGWKWSWWQYTSTAKFNGIRGGADSSVWGGTHNSLRVAAGLKPLPTAPVPTPTPTPGDSLLQRSGDGQDD